MNRAKLSPEGADRVVSASRAVFQRENRSQEVYSPTVRSFFNYLLEEESRRNEPKTDFEKAAATFAPDKSCLPRTYKGVSYNPLLPEFGERFDMLDFFAWGARAQKAEPFFQFLVLDASLYWAVNAMGRMPVEMYSKGAAKKLVDTLCRELENGSDTSRLVKEAEGIRNRYLRAVASLLPNGTCQVLSAKELWKDNDAYVARLQDAIDFVAESKVEGEPFRFGKCAQYSRYNQEYQKWYTPLVLGEAKYLYDAYGISAKLGPTSETAFDSLIRQLLGAKYCIFWYTRPLERQLAYSDYVFFNDSDKVVEGKLGKNSQLAEWLGEIASALLGEKLVGRKEIVDGVNRLKKEVNGRALSPPETPSTPGDWWFQWPPGACG